MNKIVLLTLLLLTNTCFSADYQLRIGLDSEYFKLPPQTPEQIKAKLFCNGYVTSDFFNYDSGTALPSYSSAMLVCQLHNEDNRNIFETCQNLSDNFAKPNEITKEFFLAACETGNVSSINKNYTHSIEDFCESKAKYYLEMNPDDGNNYTADYIKTQCMTN